MMNNSNDPRRGPFRPINTLASPQKPKFTLSADNKATLTPHTESSSSETDLDSLPCVTEFLPAQASGYKGGRQAVNRISFEENNRGDSIVGDSSSLFEEEDIEPLGFLPSPGAGKSTVRNPQNVFGAKVAPNLRRNITGLRETAHSRNTMVNQREASKPNTQAQPPIPKALQDLTNTPQFGETSPLRNPLKKDARKDEFSHLFNIPKPNQARPEHHRAQNSQQAQAPPPFTIPPKVHPFSQSNAASSRSSYGSDIVEIPRPVDFFPANQPQNSRVPVEISKPGNYPTHTTHPAPRPMYSSMGGTHGFQPVNIFGQRNIIDLTRKIDDNEFDPDAALREDQGKFGAVDPFMYIDAAKANENIKALLEGAFDDDEDKIPRTRGRKKKQQQNVTDDATNDLAEKLQALDVKAKEEEAKAEAEEEDEEEDDGSVEGLTVKLLPHQVDGVAWMTDKEVGVRKKNGVLPKGGILADDMGLGKTIQSLALILSNPRPPVDAPPENPKNKIPSSVGKGTLVVAPLALIKQWESEINTKVLESHRLRVLVHHGPSRTKDFSKLKKYDVVITTYNVLSSEHSNSDEREDGVKAGCFGVHWYRVILDEAHSIKNRNAKMTKACYDLRSHYRWCLTGTPMQNNLDELQSLIKFLRIKPYDELKNWKDSITGPMKNGRGGLAMKRLQYFLKAFMKRRTKDVLKKEGALNPGGKVKEGGDKSGGFRIVARNIETVVAHFTPEEHRFYNRLASRAQDRLEEMMGGEKADYIGALVLLLRLRQACNHPELIKSNVKNDKDALATGSTSPRGGGSQAPRRSRDTEDKDVDDIAAMFGGLSVESKKCDVCQANLSQSEVAAGALRCEDCENDLSMSQRKKHKHKHRSKQHKSKKQSKKHRETEKEESTSPEPQKLARNRRVILDSDDEDEGEGDWVVPLSQQDVPDLGKAGGTDDENAEGGGEWLKSDDSETDGEGSPVDKKKKGRKVISLELDDEEEDPKSEPEGEANSDSETESQSEPESGADSDTESDEESDSDPVYSASHLTPSTKIRHLLQILEKETPDHKVIVFSQFTSMLDLIEPFLRRNGYIFTRYDGSMRNDHREASLNKLRNDKKTRVLLCSLKCGSLGLNLTAASRVVILEPFWNPFVEEQAIDRVHRLNQTVDVTVYKLTIASSVEARILDLQDAKRKLANAAIEGGKAVAKLSMKDIMDLFKRDAEFDTRHEREVELEHQGLFERMRVLESPTKGADMGVTVTLKARKAGRKEGRSDDSVYGRR
ncbi:hypothetical protein AOQ84DRAFT_318939 [Glonium stellatum]|uniref:Uncharacterized protein n=1 Tax=Glonium stellatum TaxID=574774 RepID=A0A8E2JSP1_9PEZI|nr:hypothetical protein AOQ84DRAFT_318939 [Glonium stellatum]